VVAPAPPGLSGLRSADQLDEAGHLALNAVTGGLLVPSNYWRALEVISAVETRGLPEASELRDAYRDLYAPSPPTFGTNPAARPPADW
jgi:hypothetical protein